MESIQKRPCKAGFFMSAMNVLSGPGLAGLVGLLCALVGNAQAQVPIPAAPQPPGTVTAFVGGTIHPVDGSVIEDGVLIVRDGIIEAVGGANTGVPSAAEVIDVSGDHLYPALFSAYTALGLVEIGSIRQTTDHTEVGK